MANELAALIRTSPKTPAKSAVRPGKTTTDKILAAFDQQVADFNAGKKYDSAAHARKAWFKDLGDEVLVTVRNGNTALALHDGAQTVYTDRKNFKQVAKILRANLVAGEYKAEIDDMDKARADKRAAKKA